MLVTFHGHEVLTYLGYIDTSTGQTLVCEPGGTYEIIPEITPGDGRFSEVPKKTQKPKPETEEG